MNIAPATRTGLDLELKIGKLSGSFVEVCERRFSQWSAAQVGVQDDTGRVNDRTEGVRQRLSEMFFDGFAHAIKGKSQRGLIEPSRADFVPQAPQHNPGGVGDRGCSLAGRQSSHRGGAQHIIDRWQFSKKRGIYGTLQGSKLSHRQDCHSVCR